VLAMSGVGSWSLVIDVIEFKSGQTAGYAHAQPTSLSRGLPIGA